MSKIYGRPVATPIKLTAEQVGARPSDWMPTADDVGATPASHTKDKNNPHGVTAAQVGARPNTWTPTAGEVGARPDTWFPTAAEVGAAKSGFGLGELRGKQITDCNEALENGWYYSNGNCANAPNEHAFTMLVMTSSGYTQTQIASLGNNFSRYPYLMARKNSAGNGWTEWKQVGEDSNNKVPLWENQNIENAFDAQKIELDLSEYDGVEIVFYGDKTTDVYLNTGFLPNDKKGILAYTTSEMGYHLRREFTVTSDGIEFKAGTNTGSVPGNKVCIPYRIYGISGSNGGSGVIVRDGKSAFGYAVEAGYEGTEEEFAKMMADPCANAVKTVNGIAPDENGNVEIAGSGGNGTVVTDDGEGNVVISALSAITVTDDGNGNVVLA